MNATELMQKKGINLTFRWRYANSKESYTAICEAVSLGCNTRGNLLKALPQFSCNRLIVALEQLIAAGMAQLDFGCLSVSEDMLIVKALAAGQNLELPIDVKSFNSNPHILHDIFLKIGLQNPSGAQNLLKYSVTEIDNGERGNS